MTSRSFRGERVGGALSRVAGVGRGGEEWREANGAVAWQFHIFHTLLAVAEFCPLGALARCHRKEITCLGRADSSLLDSELSARASPAFGADAGVTMGITDSGSRSSPDERVGGALSRVAR